MSKYSKDATTALVVAYLRDATGKSEIDIVNAIGRHKEILISGIQMRSFADYVGNKIAQADGLEFRDDFDPDAEEDEE